VALDCVGFDMPKYALVIRNVVHSVFETEKPMSAFPDIEKYLVDVSEKECGCNYKLDGDVFCKPVDLSPPFEDAKIGIITKVLNYLGFKNE
jgi:hypothetical protein